MSQEIESQIHYQFTDKQLLHQALTASGAEDFDTIHSNQQRDCKDLALVGDALLRLIIVDDWEVQSLASNEHLCDIGMRRKLDAKITRNSSQKGDVGKVTMASTMEALVGAVWFDSGKNLDAIREIVGFVTNSKRRDAIDH
ncbi:hypothetical protein MRB53_038470 [Persea americana]|nr:hypothetical protein MRB53_038470 [Persea americana]